MRLLTPLAMTLCGMICSIATVGATPPPSSSSTPQVDLATNVRELIREAKTSSALNTLAERGTRIGGSFQEALFPKGYQTYLVHEPTEPLPFAIVTTPTHSSFLVYSPDFFRNVSQTPDQWLARVAITLAPELRGYQEHVLRNGVVYSASGKPTLVFLISEGPPSGSHHASYRSSLLIFPPGVTALTLDAPCEWWTVTSPPNWPKRLNPRDCIPTWTAVPHT